MRQGVIDEASRVCVCVCAFEMHSYPPVVCQWQTACLECALSPNHDLKGKADDRPVVKMNTVMY